MFGDVINQSHCQFRSGTADVHVMIPNFEYTGSQTAGKIWYVDQTVSEGTSGWARPTVFIKLPTRQCDYHRKKCHEPKLGTTLGKCKFPLREDPIVGILDPIPILGNCNYWVFIGSALFQCQDSVLSQHWEH